MDKLTYHESVKDLILKMRLYYLIRRWSRIDVALARYKEQILCSEIEPEGYMKAISLDTDIVHEISTDDNFMGYRHWFYNIAYYARQLDYNKQYDEQSREYLDKLEERYGKDLTKEFFYHYKELIDDR